MRVTVDDHSSPPVRDDEDSATVDAEERVTTDADGPGTTDAGDGAADGETQDAATEEHDEDAAADEVAAGDGPDADGVDAEAPDTEAAADDASADDTTDGDAADTDLTILDDSDNSGADDPDSDSDSDSTPAAWADEARPPTALTWLDAGAVGAASVSLDADEDDDLLSDARLVPGWLRPRVLVPIGIVAALCGAYVGTTLLWPLHEVAPTITASTVEIAPAPEASIEWPATGSAAVSVSGVGTVASTTAASEIASITKVASTMMVLDELPLAPGEQGPTFSFDNSDARDFWSYLRSNQSALDVPVGGTLTEYQMLQGVMLGSANNYIDRMSDELWGSDRGFAEASAAWLTAHGIEGMTLVSPSGFDTRNVATPASLIKLGELAMRDPVFAEIAGTSSAEIPGVGTVTNSNRMLADVGVVGVKTGTLSGWNLLTAKDVEVDGTTVRLFTAVLGQDSNDDRLAVTRSLLAQVEQNLADQPTTIPVGTVVGSVSTQWGARADVITDADAEVVLWNGASATSSSALELGEDLSKGAEVGTLTLSGPLNEVETAVSLDAEIPEPSAWWRLTHPLELFGLDGH